MRKQVLLDTDIILLLHHKHEIVRKNVADYLAYLPRLSFTELTWYEVVRGYRIIEAHRQLEIFESFCHNIATNMY